jgi:hypothetical protein
LSQGKKNAYGYLGQSIEEFPGRGRGSINRSDGFRNAKAEPLSRGIVTIYTAEKEGAVDRFLAGSICLTRLAHRPGDAPH